MDAHEQLAGALNLMQLAPNARQPRIYPPQSGGLADSTGTDSREGYTSPYGPGEASTTERKRSDEGAVAVVDGGEAKKGERRERTTAVARRTRRVTISPQPMIQITQQRKSRIRCPSYMISNTQLAKGSVYSPTRISSVGRE